MASDEKDTDKLIVEVAERLFRQIGFQKTTVADIARAVLPERTQRLGVLSRNLGLWVTKFYKRVLRLDIDNFEGAHVLLERDGEKAVGDWHGTATLRGRVGRLKYPADIRRQAYCLRLCSSHQLACIMQRRLADVAQAADLA